MLYNNYAFQYKRTNNRVLQHHFGYVILPPALLTESALSRMTAPLSAIFGPLINSRDKTTFPLQSCVIIRLLG